MDHTTQIVFIVFTIAIAVSVFIQTIAILGMGLAVVKMQKKAQALIDEVRGHALPVISSSRAIIEDIAPKIKTVSANLVETSNQLKGVAAEVVEVVGDVAERTRSQAAHVDGMVQGTLEHLTQAGNSIQHGISIPMRQMTGIINGLRAAINVMRGKPTHGDIEIENDLFV